MAMTSAVSVVVFQRAVTVTQMVIGVAVEFDIIGIDFGCRVGISGLVDILGIERQLLVHRRLSFRIAATVFLHFTWSETRERSA